MMKKEKKANHPTDEHEKKKAEKAPSYSEKCTEFYRLTAPVWSEKRVFSENGIPVLTWEGCFPAPDDSAFGGEAAARRVREFYAEMAWRAARYVRDELLPAVTASLRAGEDGERYRFRRFSLRHMAEAGFEKNADRSDGNESNGGDGAVFCVRRTLTLSRGGRVILEEKREERFRYTDGLPLPTRRKEPRKQPAKKSK